MSEPENFLTRWSRRKQQAELEPERPDDAATAPQVDSVDAVAVTDPAVDAEKEPEVDLSTLPPVETIGADTDVRAFLQKGVPLNLTRAALSRAWAADPAIRDFIGIAENQWDFASGNIPGFGPLNAADDIARMVAQISTEGFPRLPEPAATPDAKEKAGDEKEGHSPASDGDTALAAPIDEAPPSDPIANVQPHENPEADQRLAIVQREDVIGASQHVDASPGQVEQAPRRPHGGALPH